MNPAQQTDPSIGDQQANRSTRTTTREEKNTTGGISTTTPTTSSIDADANAAAAGGFRGMAATTSKTTVDGPNNATAITTSSRKADLVPLYDDEERKEKSNDPHYHHSQQQQQQQQQEHPPLIKSHDEQKSQLKNIATKHEYGVHPTSGNTRMANRMSSHINESLTDERNKLQALLLLQQGPTGRGGNNTGTTISNSSSSSRISNKNVVSAPFPSSDVSKQGNKGDHHNVDMALLKQIHEDNEQRGAITGANMGTNMDRGNPMLEVRTSSFILRC